MNPVKHAAPPECPLTHQNGAEILETRALQTRSNFMLSHPRFGVLQQYLSYTKLLFTHWSRAVHATTLDKRKTATRDGGWHPLSLTHTHTHTHESESRAIQSKSHHSPNSQLLSSKNKHPRAHTRTHTHKRGRGRFVCVCVVCVFIYLHPSVW
jgi:hypothetical protein